MPRAYSITASLIASWALSTRFVTAPERLSSMRRTNRPATMPINVIAATGGAMSKNPMPMMAAVARPPESPVRQMVMNSSS